MTTKYRAFEHANDLHGDCKRWYVAQEDAQGFHGQPKGGTMDREEAEAKARRLNKRAREA